MQDPEESLDRLLSILQERAIDAVVVVYLLNSVVKTSNISIPESSVLVRFMDVPSFLYCVIWALSRDDRNIAYFGNGDDLSYII